jgi:hypothetical protein
MARMSQSNCSARPTTWNHVHPVAMGRICNQKYIRFFCALLVQGPPQPDLRIYITAVTLVEL